MTEAGTWAIFLKVNWRTKEVCSLLLGSEYELYTDRSKKVKDWFPPVVLEGGTGGGPTYQTQPNKINCSGLPSPTPRVFN